MADIKNIMKPPQEGGWTEEETQAFMKKHEIKTIQELVEKYGPAKDILNVSTGTVPRTSKGWKQSKSRASVRNRKHGGYVKKYARGGGVRKAR